MITFRADVTLRRSTPILGEFRFSPNIQFLIPNFDRRYGLTKVDATEFPFADGETKSARVSMIIVPETEPLIHVLMPGTEFVLWEGARQIATGTIRSIEELTVDFP